MNVIGELTYLYCEERVARLVGLLLPLAFWSVASALLCSGLDIYLMSKLKYKTRESVDGNVI